MECCLRAESTADEATVREAVAAYVARLGSVVEHAVISVADDAFLSANVEAIAVGGRDDDGAWCAGVRREGRERGKD